MQNKRVNIDDLEHIEIGHNINTVTILLSRTNTFPYESDKHLTSDKAREIASLLIEFADYVDGK